MSQCIHFSVKFQYNSLFLVSHKTYCTNFLHLQTLCLKTSTIFFLIKCSFLQRINRGAAGLLGAETIISSKNSDFQKQKCTFKINYCCTIQSGSGHLYRSIAFQKRECIFKISRTWYKDITRWKWTHLKECIDRSIAFQKQKCIFKANFCCTKVHFQKEWHNTNTLQNESGPPQGIYRCQHCCCSRIFAIVWNCGGQWKAMQQLSDERLLQMRSFFLRQMHLIQWTNTLDVLDEYTW